MTIHPSIPLELPIEDLSESKQEKATGVAGDPVQ